MSTARSAHSVLLIAIFSVAFWLRVHQLEQLPAGLHFDEAANAILASEIAFDRYRPIFISSYTGKETLFFYAAGGVINRVGRSIFSLRLTAAFFGLLTIAATYRLGTAIFKDRRVALTAAIILAVNFSHLLFSRLGFRAISQPLTQALTVLFLVDGFQRLSQQRPAGVRFAAAGLFLGLTAHTYLAARLFPLALAIPLVIVAVFWLKNRPLPTHPIKLLLNIGLTGLVGALVLGPLLYWFYLHPEAFWVRISQVGSSAESITILEGLRRSALMLFWEGDPYIRFNIPRRPLFFVGMIIPAAIGVWHIWANCDSKDSGAFFGRLIVLIAPLIMLLPTALATNEIVPSNLRAIGIFPFIVFWPAVGLVWLVDWLLRQIKRGAEFEMSLRHAFIPFYIIFLGMSAVNVYQAYLGEWGNRPDGFYETEGDIREVAAYLNELETDRPLLVSTRFVPHPGLAFLTEKYDQLRLVPESRAVVYPAGEPPLIVYPHSSPENSWMATLEGEREQHVGRSQIPAFTTLALTQPFPEPYTAAFGNFGFAAELTGYDLEPGKVGEHLTVRTYYEVMGTPGFNMVPFVHLEDHLGNRWGQLEQPGYSPEQWQAGDLFVQQFELSLPAGLPPTSNYTLRIGWFDGDTGQEVTRFDRDGQFAGSAFLIEEVAVLPNKNALLSADPPQQINQPVTDRLTLTGLDFDRNKFNQGDRLSFALWWEASGPLPDMKLVTQLEQNGNVVELERVDPAGDSYPFSTWETPAFVIDHHQIQLPADLLPGEWELQLLVQFEDRSTQPLLDPIPIKIEPLDLVFDPPPMGQLVGETFGEEIGLVGFSLDEASGELELVWRAIGEPAGDYVAFVQLLNSDQTCCIWQADRPMMSSAARPTSRWLVGEFVVDRYEVEGVEGGAQLIVGVYRPENGIRLTTSSSADFIELR